MADQEILQDGCYSIIKSPSLFHQPWELCMLTMQMMKIMKTYWSAATSNKGEWIQTDLGNVSTVNAIQINYADQDVDQMIDSLEKSLVSIININCIILLMEKNGMC